ncbi:MAG TPA: histidinol-phosphate transaminase [Kofleriaceae bacterium]|nr:histidinol-phosphate transaminase [Kofleriaceae bacterium]
MTLDDLVPPHIRELRPYQPGKPIEELERELGITGAIKVASNENPLGPSPAGVAAAAAALADVNVYPEDDCHKLRRALAARHDVDPAELVFGSGSNDIIYMMVQAFTRPGDEVLTHQHAFITYRLAARGLDCRFVEAPVTADLAADVDALLAAVTPRTRMLFLGNPNNPTGGWLPRAEFERLLARLPREVFLVVDEAYHEYAVELAPDYAQAQRYRGPDHANLVVLRTSATISGLAGLRVGYGVCDRAVADYLGRVRRPFCVSSVAQAAALAALDDAEHVRRSQAAAAAGIPALAEAAHALGLRAYPSAANFLLVDVGREAAPVYDALLRRGVIVRALTAWGLPRHLRISIGTAEQTARIIDALRAVL